MTTSQMAHRKWAALERIAGFIKSNGTSGVPIDEVRDFASVVPELIRDGVLVQDRESIRFFHESLFDHVLARSWAETATGVVDAVLSTNQDLSHRSLVRQVLTYQKGIDPSAYERSITELLADDRIRFHFKELALSVLRSDPRPTAKLWSAVASIIVNSTAPGRCVASEILKEKPWFEYADAAGAILAWAASEDSELHSIVAESLWAAQLRDPDRVGAILGALLPIDRWHGFTRRLIAAAQPRGSVIYLELIANAIGRGLYDDGQQFLDDSFIYAIQRGVDADERMPSRVVDALVARTFVLAEENNSLSNLARRDYSISEFFLAAAHAAPAEYLRMVLPRLTHFLGAEDLTESSTVGRDPWLDHYISSHPDAGEALLDATKRALIAIAKQTPRQFRRTTRDLLPMLGKLTVRSLLYQAWTANPSVFAEEAVHHVLEFGTPFRCGYIDSPYWITREFFAAVHPYLDTESRRALESAILEFVPTWERRSGRQSRGLAQFVLLGGLDASRLSLPARRRRTELQRKFAEYDAEPRPVQVGFVPSPIPPQAAARMTDRQWLSAMKKYRSERGPNLSGGGAHELSSVLQVEARAFPRRFAQLVTRFPDDVNPAYVSAILIGIADSAVVDDAPVIFDAIRHIHNLPNRPAGRWIGKPLARLAEADLPVDILDIVAWYAIYDPDPEGDLWAQDVRGGAYFGGDPLTAGINSVRGAAAETMSALIWAESSRVSILAEALQSVCADRSSAVRSCAALAVISVARHDERFGLELFRSLVDGVDDRVLATQYAERCVSVFGRSKRSGLVPLVRRMLDSSFESVREAGGRQAALIGLDRSEPALVRTALTAGASARRGVAQVAAANVSNADLRGQSAEWLLQFFHDSDETVRRAAAEWLSSYVDGQYGLTDLIEAFIAAPAFLDDPSPTLWKLDESTRIPGAILLQAVRQVAEHQRENLVDMSTSLSADAGLVAKLAIRAYGSAHNEAVREKALEVIDSLISLRASPMRSVVLDYEEQV